MRLLILFLTFTLHSLSAMSQTVCEPLRYFNPGGQEVVYTHNLPTPWFGIRFTPQWDARVDSAYISFGIQKNNSAMVYDTLEVRVLDSTLPTFTVLDFFRAIIPANFNNQIPDDYWIVQFDFDGGAAIIQPPRDFWISWRLKGASVNVARIRLRKPAHNPDRSVVINPNGSTIPISTYTWSQIQDTVDLWAEVRVCYVNGIPVEFETFSATYINGQGILQWKTASETNNHGFEVERTVATSEKGLVTLWQKIGFVPGQGTTTRPHSYRFEDPNPHAVMDANGRVRYRLKQIDFDGSYDYSSVQEVVIPGSSKSIQLSEVFPSPVTTTLREASIEISSQGITGNLIVTDVLGRVIHKEVVTTTGGVHRVAFPTTKLVPGNYFIQLFTGSQALVRRFTVSN